MINKTIEKIEASIRKMDHVDPRKKEEVSRLLATLKTEIEALSKTHQDRAENITAHLGSLSSKGLSASVEGFEASHPKLVQTINDFCNLLSGIGI